VTSSKRPLNITATNFLPVVQRELREGARRPFNYWLRVGGASAGVWLLFVLSKRDLYSEPSTAGLHLFISLHLMMLALICVIVPAMSADCIAREKREGTLGLLFLTPLSAMGIAMGKGLVQAFRAFTLWVAVLPVLIIPVLSGGVTGGDVASALIIEFCITLHCLAAGILASSLAKARATAFVLAAGFTVWFVSLFAGLLGLGYLSQVPGPGRPARLTQLMQTGQSLLTGQSSGSFPIFGGGAPLVLV
jgi:ABC-type transport system involved in multi-copper enzyme maturation permease subunit